MPTGNLDEPVSQGIPSLLLIALLGVALSGLVPQAGASDSVRVMSYNIAAGNGDLSAIVDAIRKEEPDIVGLQEVDVHWSERSGFEHQAKRLAEELNMEVFFAPIYTLPPRDEGRSAREFGLAFLSRRPIERSQNHELSRLSTQERSPEPAKQPGFAEIVVSIDGIRLRLFNTHLDYRPDPRVRKQQVAEMLEVIGALDVPTILLGDLNARPDARELRPLFERFRDVWDEERQGPGHTYPAMDPDRRIDYILTSPELEVEHAGVVVTEASDHRPLVAEILVPAR